MTEPPPSSGEHPLLERSHLPGVNLNCASHRPEDGSRCYTTSTPERVSTPTASAHTDPQSGSSCGHTNAVDDIPTKEEKNQTNERMATPVRQHGTSPPTSPSSTWNPQPSTIEYEGRPHQVRADERPRSRSPSVTFLTISYGADGRLVRYQFVIDERTQCMALRNAMDRADDYLHGIPHPRVYGPYQGRPASKSQQKSSKDLSQASKSTSMPIQFSCFLTKAHQNHEQAQATPIVLCVTTKLLLRLACCVLACCISCSISFEFQCNSALNPISGAPAVGHIFPGHISG